jgi:signal transduction histidine kinase
VQVLTRDGGEKWLSCSYTKVPDPEGGPGLLIVMARDATSAHELEKLKSDFVSIVSHELRTPLAPIMGWARGLLKNADKFTEDQKRSGLESILRQAQRLEALILNILEVSRIEVGANQPRDEIVDVPAAIDAVVGELLESWVGREIRVSTPADVRAHGSQLWIEQIITNLLSNALKYSPADAPIDVTVTQEPGVVHLAVADRGGGIPERDLDRIFQRFERLSGTDTQPGTGLGLYVGRKLAEAVDGSLEVKSVVDHGSTFTLTLKAPVRLTAVS